MGEREGKAEALDLIINTLKEHEKSLDEAIEELKTVIREAKGKAVGAVVECESWADFKMRGKGAKAIALQVQNKNVTLIAIVGVTVYRHVLSLRKWLSEELDVSEGNISD